MIVHAKPIRVLVIEDRLVRRGELAALLRDDPDFEISGSISSGPQALKTVLSLKPQIIVMDLEQPQPQGVQLARYIMQEAPTPIVMVLPGTVTRTPLVTDAATAAGVLAIMDKPVAGEQSRTATELLSTIKSMAKVKVIRRWEPERLHRSTPAARPTTAVLTRRFQVVAIGASTGGPQVLQEILSRLPENFRLPILVVQHIAPGFLESFIEWLRPLCVLPIQRASVDMPLSGPGIYVAPTDHHLLVSGRVLSLNSTPLVSGHRPAATVLFQSVAAVYGARAIGVLLTGMGDDGAAGLSDIKQAGGVTIAQSEASSVVFGMPAAAIGMGIVDYVLAPREIAGLLVKLAKPNEET